jgi:hypothetical protein
MWSDLGYQYRVGLGCIRFEGLVETRVERRKKTTSIFIYKFIIAIIVTEIYVGWTITFIHIAIHLWTSNIVIVDLHHPHYYIS